MHIAPARQTRNGEEQHRVYRAGVQEGCTGGVYTGVCTRRGVQGPVKSVKSAKAGPKRRSKASKSVRKAQNRQKKASEKLKTVRKVRKRQETSGKSVRKRQESQKRQEKQ